MPKCYLCGAETNLRFHGVSRCMECDAKDGAVKPWELPPPDALRETGATDSAESIQETTTEDRDESLGGLTPEPA